MSFYAWHMPLSTTIFNIIHIVKNYRIPFFLWLDSTLLCIGITFSPFIQLSDGYYIDSIPLLLTYSFHFCINIILYISIYLRKDFECGHKEMINVWCDSYSNHLNLIIIWCICDWYTIIYHINMYSYYLSIKNKAEWKRGKVSLKINSTMLEFHAALISCGLRWKAPLNSFLLSSASLIKEHFNVAIQYS